MAAITIRFATIRIALAVLCAVLAGPYVSHADSGQFAQKIIAAARAQIGRTVFYDGSYRPLTYPGGDIPIERGVCTDVLIRAYRSVGIDLQREVHEDMRANFALYPSLKLWGLKRPDSNIDHRRVPNLAVFFRRFGRSFAIGDRTPFQPGDIITWNLPGNLPHIGLVSDRRSPQSGRYLIIHNIGRGVREEDMSDQFPMTGRYRYPR